MALRGLFARIFLVRESGMGGASNSSMSQGL
jgi:hypothetical protein